jgi:hypothetical protein
MSPVVVKTFASMNAPEQLIPDGGEDELHTALSPAWAAARVGEAEIHPKRTIMVPKNIQFAANVFAILISSSSLKFWAISTAHLQDGRDTVRS